MTDYNKALEKKIEQGITLYEKSDYKSAFVHFQEVAQQQYPRAWFWLAKLYQEGRGVTKNTNKVKELLNLINKASDEKDPIGIYALSLMYKNGYGTDENKQDAFRLCQQSAEMGYAVAQRDLGEMYNTGYRGMQNDQLAFTWTMKAAEQGDVIANCNLGWLYYEGRGVEEDSTKAIHYWKKAADEDYELGKEINHWIFGQCEGYNRLLENEIENGIRYYNKKDYEKAFEIFTKVAEKKYPRAWFWLAKMFHKGKGRNRNEKEVKRYFNLLKSASDRGDAIAQNSLGEMGLNGYGVEKDGGLKDLENKVLDIQYFRKAAEKGYAQAEFNHSDYAPILVASMREFAESEFIDIPNVALLVGGLTQLRRKIVSDNSFYKAQYKKAANKGCIQAQIQMAESDATNKLYWYRLLEGRENGYGLRMLGNFYFDKKDYKKAFQYYKRAAFQGEVRAMGRLGNVYWEWGQKRKAHDWWQRAATRGCATSKYNIGVLYDDRDNFDYDKDYAMCWYQESAEDGYQDAIKLYREKRPHSTSYKEKLGFYKYSRVESTLQGFNSLRRTDKRSSWFSSLLFDYYIPNDYKSFVKAIIETLWKFRNANLSPFYDEDETSILPFWGGLEGVTFRSIERCPQGESQYQFCVFLNDDDKVCKKFYLEKDYTRGWPQKENDNYYYWFIFKGPNNVKIEGLRIVMRSCDFETLGSKEFQYYINYLPTAEINQWAETKRQNEFKKSRNEEDQRQLKEKRKHKSAITLKHNLIDLRNRVNTLLSSSHENTATTSYPQIPVTVDTISNIITEAKENAEDVDRVFVDFFNSKDYLNAIEASQLASKLDMLILDLEKWEWNCDEFLIYLKGYFNEVITDLEDLKTTFNEKLHSHLKELLTYCSNNSVDVLTKLYNDMIEEIAVIPPQLFTELETQFTRIHTKVNMLANHYQNELQNLSSKKELTKQAINRTAEDAEKKFNQIAEKKILAAENYNHCTKQHRELELVSTFYSYYASVISDIMGAISKVSINKLSMISEIKSTLDNTDDMIIEDASEIDDATPVRLTVKPAIALTLLALAIESEDPRKVERVLKQLHPKVNQILGGRYETKMWTPLHLAATKENVNIIHLLMTQDPALEIPDMHGNTPLLLSIQHRQTKIVETLLDYGANKEAYNDDEKSANDLAIESGNEQLMRLFSANEDNDAMVTETGPAEGETIAEPENKRRRLAM